MNNAKAELFFKISGRYWWSEVRDTVNRITAEFGGKHVVRIEVEQTPCYADEPVKVQYPSEPEVLSSSTKTH